MARRSGVDSTVFGGVASFGAGWRFISDVDIRSRVAELLRLEDERRSSSDFSFRRRGSVANLSPVGDLVSRLIGPSLVLIIRCSGVEDPARPGGLVHIVALAPIDGHRPSSTVGVAAGVRRETDGVRVLLERCNDGDGLAPVGRESGFAGRLSGVERVGVVAAFFINGGNVLSRDRARSRDVSTIGADAATTFD